LHVEEERLATRRRQQQVEVEVSQGSSTGVLSDPLYGVAMLKIALELKRPDARPFESIVQEVMGRMGLEESAFRQFLSRQGGLLQILGRV
jgi:hypothetical protein